MTIYDVTGSRVEYVKPETNLTAWGAAHKPFALCNASLYDGGISTVRRPSGPPVGTVLEDGKLVRHEGNYPGIGIKNGKIGFGRPFEETWNYFLAGYNCPVIGGTYNPPAWQDSYVFGSRNYRIGIGQLKDGRIVIATDDGVTLEQYARHAISRDFVTLVNLDGGGSRHLLYNNRLVYQSPRIPYNALAFYKEKPTEDTSCPYAEPVSYIRWGSIGEGAKWTQWQLTRHNFPLDVDGLFFGQSVAALRAFQAENGLTADGVCGPRTIEVLKT